MPLIASATATLLFRQFFLTIPDELVEAAKIDGAGPLRFFSDILLPLSRTNIAALFVILFIYGWNQYLWPLLITTSRSMDTIVIGITKMIGTGDAQTDWNLIMATAVLAMLPPVAVVVLMQRWFVKGLVETREVKDRCSWRALALGCLAAVAAPRAFAAAGPATLVAAHRGGALLWPENSLLAFRNAAESSAPTPSSSTCTCRRTARWS